MKFVGRLSAMFVAAVLAAGCSVSGNDTGSMDGQTPDTMDEDDRDPGDRNPDDPPPPPPPPAGECSIEGAVDLSGAQNLGFVQPGQQNDSVVAYVGELENGAVFVELWEGYGAFENGLAAGTYPVEPDPLTCGVCVGIATADDRILMASGGTVVIDAVEATAGARLSGSLSNAQFSEVDDQGQSVSGGCTASVADHSFDVTLELEEQQQ